jgi:hypothetical protein
MTDVELEELLREPDELSFHSEHDNLSEIID